MNIRRCLFFLSLVVLSSVAVAQTNFYEQVSQMWLSGQKTNVLNIGLQRLSSDTNEIAGLILKLEYEVAYLDFTNIPITAERVLNRGATISTTNFVSQYQQYQVNNQIMVNVLSNYPPEEIESDRAKASITNKPMTFGDMIKALEDDGYFQP